MWLAPKPFTPAGTDGGDEDGLSESVSQLSLGGPRHPVVSPSIEASVCSQPIRGFRWSDHTVEPGCKYTFSIFLVVRRPAAGAADSGAPDPQALSTRCLVERPAVTLEVTTEAEIGADGHGAYFNRGCAASQAYSRHFGSKTPREKRPSAEPLPWAWLSRGLEEGLLDFIRKAQGSGWAVRAAFYELHYQPVLQAIADVRAAGADVRFVYDAKPMSWHAVRKEWVEHGPAKLNDASIEAVGMRDVAIRRAKGLAAIQHNKFVVLLQHGEPHAVWTGSTNMTTSGLYGHFNAAHVHTDPAIVGAFLKYWDVLSADPKAAAIKRWCEDASPVPPVSWRGACVLFSPRESDAALRFYAELIRTAKQAVFLTAAFGISATIAEGLLHADPGSLSTAVAIRKGAWEESEGAKLALSRRHSTPTYVLLDNEGRGASPRFVQSLRALPHGHVTCGAYFESAGLADSDQMAEQLTELNEHVQVTTPAADPFSLHFACRLSPPLIFSPPRRVARPADGTYPSFSPRLSPLLRIFSPSLAFSHLPTLLSPRPVCTHQVPLNRPPLR